jgi:hypothetical protein
MIGAMLRRSLVVVLVILGTLPLLAAAVQGGSMPVPLPLFPQNNWWNTDVSSAPLDPSSASFITFIDNNVMNGRRLHPDFGGDAGGGETYGFPFIVVDSTQPKLTVTFTDFGDQSDGVDHDTDASFPFYPVPTEAITMNGWVEGGPPGNVDLRDDGDRHMLIVDKTNNHLYELYDVWYNGSMWEAASGAFFDMNTNNRRPDTWTSADASGMAILPGLVRYDEVFGPDEIRHAFRFTVRSTNGYVYPASHNAGSTGGAPPMGMRMRLKASKDISSFTPQMQKIFRAMKKYGLIVADNGSDMYISGTYDTRWDNDVLNPAFGALKVSDFEVVQRGWAPSISFILTLPSSVNANDATGATLTAYNPSYNVATGYTGTVHFTSTDGAATLPVNYTFTAGDAGTHTFPAGFTLRTAGSQIVTVTDTGNATITGSKGVTVSVGPPAPLNLVATATSLTQVALSWSASAGATQYEIVRASASSPFGAPFVTASTSYNDSSALAGQTYVYKVRALDAAAHPSSYSAPDAATTIAFTDDPLVTASTTIKAVHMTELRQAVNAMRATAGLSAATFTDPVLSTTVPVKAAHLNELRTALSQARTGLGLTAITYTDPTLVPGTTGAKALHVTEIRNGVK